MRYLSKLSLFISTVLFIVTLSLPAHADNPMMVYLENGVTKKMECQTISGNNETSKKSFLCTLQNNKDSFGGFPCDKKDPNCL